MCTVSIVAIGGSIRLACNRDESRTRAAALPPAFATCGGVRSVMPIDPPSGGSWLVATELGLLLALLNVNLPLRTSETDRRRDTRACRSRGEILPRVAGSRTTGELLGRLGRIDRSAYAPFRVVAATRDCVLEIGPAGCVKRHALTSPLMFTSSGLGDSLVEGPRRALFRRLMASGSDYMAAQDRFHLHRWRSSPHLSVLMQRADARTVSRTVVELHRDRLTMIYWPTPARTSGAAGVVAKGLELARTRGARKCRASV